MVVIIHANNHQRHCHSSVFAYLLILVALCSVVLQLLLLPTANAEQRIIFGDDGGPLLHYKDSDGDEQMYSIPKSLQGLPEDIMIREAMNLLLEQTLDDIDDLMTDLEQLSDSGMDLDNDVLDDDDDIQYEYQESDDEGDDAGEDDDGGLLFEDDDDPFLLGKDGSTMERILSVGMRDRDGSDEDGEIVPCETDDEELAYECYAKQFEARRNARGDGPVRLSLDVKSDPEEEVAAVDAAAINAASSGGSMKLSPGGGGGSEGATESSSSSSSDAETAESATTATADPVKTKSQQKAENILKTIRKQQYIHANQTLAEIEIKILRHFFEEVKGTALLVKDWNWLNDDVDYCRWGGITCEPMKKNWKAVIPLGQGSDIPSDQPATVRAAKEAEANGTEFSANTTSGFLDDSLALKVPPDVITRIELPGLRMAGVLPTCLAQLENLEVLNLAFNELHGTIPKEYGINFTAHGLLKEFDVSFNRLTGTVPRSIFQIETLEDLRLSANDLTGTIPDIRRSQKSSYKMRLLDIAQNHFNGTLPTTIGRLTSLEMLLFGLNLLTGTLPTQLQQLSNLTLLEGSTNILEGSIERVVKKCLPKNKLYDVILDENMLSGSLPRELGEITSLEYLILSDNWLTGPLPTVHGDRGDNDTTTKTTNSSSSTSYNGDGEKDAVDASIQADTTSPTKAAQPAVNQSSAVWPALQVLWLAKNGLSGSLPTEMLVGLQSSLRHLDLSSNGVTGTIPSEIGQLSELHTIDVMSNKLRGTIPTAMLKLNRNLRLNFTDNLLTGKIPGLFCGEGASSMSMLYKEFGCDAVLCRAGTFSDHGHATLHSACRKCPAFTEDEGGDNETKPEDPPKSQILGSTSCPGVEFIHGDFNGDGVLSAREILRMLYIDTLGRFWGLDYQNWADMEVKECDLKGVTCLNGKIVRIDLTNANMCSDGNRKPAPIAFCKGIPAEIGELSSLAILQLTRRQFLRGTIPTSIGQLKELRLLDISSCNLSGTLPTELGLLTKLEFFKAAHTRFHGTIPSELFALTTLEALHLTNNRLSGTIPLQPNLPRLKEFMIARNDFTGRLPDFRSLTKLENFEAYHNNIQGEIPRSIGECTNLKRIDIFSNTITGPIPDSITNLSSLQILHLKINKMTGTIPEITTMPKLSWVDLSDNFLHGTIPSSWGSSKAIKDLRLGMNRFYDPLPVGLCSNPDINSGVTKKHGCAGILCPIGTYSEVGHAVEPHGCTKCPAGESTLYLGSFRKGCRVFTEKMILAMLFDVMNGPSWSPMFQANWGNYNVALCEWAGLTCDENGELDGISFPLSGMEEY